MDISQPDLDGRIGERVRQLRADRGLTLDQLACQAGVSRAMISRVERGESSPTAQLLNRICGGLGITLSVLFAEPEAVSGPVARRRDQPTWRDPVSRYVRRNVSPPSTGSSVDIAEIEFPPRATVAFDNRRNAGVDQHIWILEGTLDLEVAGEVFHLETGDCLWMPHDRPVVFRNSMRRSVRYAVIVDRDTPSPRQGRVGPP